MARMYPRTLHEPDLKSRAEKKVFAALEGALDDSWEVFHSAGWLIRDKKKGSKDGEIDFVLCHPEQGVLCLEVKGGGLDCNHGEWHRIEGGKRERMSDPFQQALDHRYALKRKLGGMVGKGGEKLRMGHALAFPDISVHKLVLAPDVAREIVIDRNDMAEIGAAIERALTFHAGSEKPLTAPGSAGVDKIREILAPELRIDVPLAEEFMEEQEQQFTLTHEQALLLHRHGRQRRMVVTGPAGSGKTFLAMERAQRLAAKGKRVLVVCFNRALRDHLRAKYRDENLLINNFHSACVALAKKAEIPLSIDDGGEPTQEYWNEELPMALMAAIDKLGKQYDALFVDEAQDLHDDWYEALTYTLKDPDDSYIWLFMDDNQRVYDSNLNVPDGFQTWDLTVNCRNTQAIHREVIKKYEGEVEPEALGPEGREVELFHTKDAASVVTSRIAELCDEGEVVPQDIVVLSSHNIENSAVAQAGCGDYTFVKDPKAVGPYIRFSSIRGFKGLESPVVILCELEDTDEKTRDRQLYVGFSRARNHCVVVAPPS